MTEGTTPTPGSLYLGSELDAGTGESTDERLHLDSDRLTTHGVIVGMTGSGKTGLGIVLVEEVLASGVPVLVIDPKGDMGNLLLNFPDFRPEDFEPWVDAGTAKRDGVTRQALATSEAETWKGGLERAGITPGRMRALRDGVDIRVLTPGSTAGTPLNLVGDLSAPAVSWEEHGESLRDEIEGLVSGLLVLVDVEADPLTSREHILLSNLIEHAWRAGASLDLPTLLLQVQNPPMRRLGVFELETFYPEKERTRLALRLNGLLASPAFAEWILGEPLDIQSLLWAPDGRPRASILHLAHLSDAERMFVVTVILSKFVTWMRKLPGTSELKALIYADEVMGFAPPSAEPPSKRPILTMFKQARAHGVGLVLATQNPVDLDYKLMSNAGTWMVGRLQTERDKERIVEGLRSASGEVDTGEWSARIGQLGKREFVLKSAKSAAPSLFTTRWAMSYLRGPLTRAELIRLGPEGVGSTTGIAGAGGAVAGVGATDGATGPAGLADDETAVPPRVADGVSVRWLDPAAAWRGQVGAASGRRHAPGLAARVHMLFDERKGDIRHEETWEAVVFPLRDGAFDAGAAVAVDHDPRDFRSDPPPDATYVITDTPLDRQDFFRSAERALEDFLFREETLELFANEVLELCSRPGESREAFRARCEAAAEDAADAEAGKLRDRYERRVDAAKKRLGSAERRVRELDVDVGQRQQQELIAGAGQVLSMFLGGRRRVSGLSGISSRRSQTRRTQERLRSAVERAEDVQETLAELEEELSEELDEIWARWKATADEIGTVKIPLERTDVRLEELLLFWAPEG